MNSLVKESDVGLVRPLDLELSEEAGESKVLAARLSRIFLIVAVSLLLLKLLLVSRREMITEGYDAEAYVRVSLRSFGSIFSGDADHPPGASLAMALARVLGVPYRIFLEIFLALAAFMFFRPLLVWTGLGIAAVALSFALLLFHPGLILEMDRAMSDPVNFLLWLAGAGGVIGFVVAPREILP
jgi:hypothetical protein